MSEATSDIHPVLLVGAGPGDPRLITVAGAEALQQAEVVLHDRLVSPALLGLANNAELIAVGKTPGGPSTIAGRDQRNHDRSGAARPAGRPPQGRRSVSSSVAGEKRRRQWRQPEFPCSWYLVSRAPPPPPPLWVSPSPTAAWPSAVTVVTGSEGSWRRAADRLERGRHCGRDDRGDDGLEASRRNRRAPDRGRARSRDASRRHRTSLDAVAASRVRPDESAAQACPGHASLR